MKSKNQAPILEAVDLTKHFHVGSFFSRRIVKAVQDASFRLYPGHVTALVGESGSGKSTVIRMLARLYEPTSGRIIFKGQDTTEIRSRSQMLQYRSEVQMIFQDPFSSLNPVHNITHHLRRPLAIHGKLGSRAESKDRIHALLKRVALTPVEEFAAKYPHQLSGGQRQRVAIARALAVEPEVMLADEPVSMLDVSIRLGILNLMAQLRDEQRIAFLYVTHDIASARYFADETMVMYAGHIVEGAESEQLIRDPKHPYTQMLLASVPDPARGLRTQEIEIRGEIPDLTKLGPGCPFAPRCNRAMDVCNTAMPGRTELPGDRWVRCYLYEGYGAAKPAGEPVVAAPQGTP